MLKFENVAKINDRIRAFDFEPMINRPSYFIEGKIVDIKDHFFVIEVDTDTCFPDHEENRIGLLAKVPKEIRWDYDDRIEII